MWKAYRRYEENENWWMSENEWIRALPRSEKVPRYFFYQIKNKNENNWKNLLQTWIRILRDVILCLRAFIQRLNTTMAGESRLPGFLKTQYERKKMNSVTQLQSYIDEQPRIPQTQKEVLDVLVTKGRPLTRYQISKFTKRRLSSVCGRVNNCCTRDWSRSAGLELISKVGNQSS